MVIVLNIAGLKIPGIIISYLNSMEKKESEIVPVLAAVIFNDKNEVLIAKRKPNLSQGNLWEFPGGKLKVYETPEACLRREIKEELGIDIQIKDLWYAVNYSYAKINILLIAYRAELVEKKITLTDHSEFKWVSLIDLNEIDFSPADRLLIKKLTNQTINF